MLSGKLKIHLCDLQDEYKIVEMHAGNSYGYTYTEGITEEDNIWINDYEIEELFQFSDHGLCEMTLYGIKNNVTAKEKNILKYKIDRLIKQDRFEEFQFLLKSLLKKNIIMVGACAC